MDEKSGNSVSEILTNKQKFQDVVEKIDKYSKDDRNKDKLKLSCKNLLNQANKILKNFKKSQNTWRIWKRYNKHMALILVS